MFGAKKNWLAFSAYIILLRKGTVGTRFCKPSSGLHCCSINKLYLFLSTLITVLQMPTPWNCPICSWFGGLSLRAVLRHVGRVHSHNANFHVCCGIDGCPRTFHKFVSYRQHLYRNHRYAFINTQIYGY